jgi:hypothetical protein
VTYLDKDQVLALLEALHDSPDYQPYGEKEDGREAVWECIELVRSIAALPAIPLDRPTRLENAESARDAYLARADHYRSIIERVKELAAHRPLRVTDLRVILLDVDLSAPVPAPRCPHNRVEMLAHQDDIPPDGPCLVWSPICRDCGDDVPMAAPPVGTQPDEAKMEEAMDDFARHTTPGGTWIFEDESGDPRE